jgi:hypothetical protein
MSTLSDIERLRLRAAFYRCEAAMADHRPRFIYCRAVAQHLEDEATELERALKSDCSKSPETIAPAP